MPPPVVETPFEREVIRSIESTTGKVASQEDRIRAALITSDVPATIGLARKLVRKKRRGEVSLSEGSATFVDGYFEEGELNIEEEKYDEVFEHTRSATLARSCLKVSLIIKFKIIKLLCRV